MGGPNAIAAHESFQIATAGPGGYVGSGRPPTLVTSRPPAAQHSTARPEKQRWHPVVMSITGRREIRDYRDGDL